MIRRTWLALSLLVLAAPAWSSCYTVYDGSRLVYQSTRSPVDLSLPLHETVPKRFGRAASMVFVADSDSCSMLDNSVNSFVPFQAGNAAVAAQLADRSASGSRTPARSGN